MSPIGIPPQERWNEKNDHSRRRQNDHGIVPVIEIFMPFL